MVSLNPQQMQIASLKGLDHKQREAVHFSLNDPLQVLAGPGSGKTKILTHRIAHMILDHNVSPSSICAITFTNKAAKEMRDRLTNLIGLERTQQLKLGTFHALCAQFLHQHTTPSGVGTNFSICDADDSLNILTPIVKKHIGIKIPTVMKKIQSSISRAKTTGVLPSGNELSIYQEYQSQLQRHKCLDFDDLLVQGIEFFTHSQEAVSWCHYVLVDEFQDTNMAQYRLMRALAWHKRITVVGDPNQSIYSWRNADVGNLDNMSRDFENLKRIWVEPNYRSTTPILNVSSAIINQGTDVSVHFNSSHPVGHRPFLRRFPKRWDEVEFIATEIKRLLAYMGGALSWRDIAILTRLNSLSDYIGKGLDKKGVPYKFIGRNKFFKDDVVEVILAYLQLADNPEYDPAFVRACKVPHRGVTVMMLRYVAASAQRDNISQFSLIEGICDDILPDFRFLIKELLAPFVRVIRFLRHRASDNAEPADMIRCLIDQIRLREYLKQDPEGERKWKNVQELISFATEHTASSDGSAESPLQSFLQATLLATSGVDDDEDKVAISTCHSAKGLEWPVVIIPAVEINKFPCEFSQNEEEERRLLYVACTRAKGLLYLTYRCDDKNGDNRLSPFVQAAKRQNHTLFTDRPPAFSPEDRQVICRTIGRPLPTEAEVAVRVAELEVQDSSLVPESAGIVDSVSNTGNNPDGRSAVNSRSRRHPYYEFSKYK